jgi:hypothetical protein
MTKREIQLWTIAVLLTIVCTIFSKQLGSLGDKLLSLPVMWYVIILLIINTVVMICLLTKMKKWMDNATNINHPKNKPM